MKKLILSLTLLCFCMVSSAADRDSTIALQLPDSIKAYGFIADIKINSGSVRKEARAGIQTEMVQLYLEADQKNREIVFEFPASAKLLTYGIGVDTHEKGELTFEYNWSDKETYKLMIAFANDSASNFSLYSAYVWLAKENKWKLIGTCKIDGRWNTMKQPALFHSYRKKEHLRPEFGPVWIQRPNGSWKNMKGENKNTPVISLTGHIDSLAQRELEIARIKNAIETGRTDCTREHNGVYYKITKEGTGPQVNLTDTVTVFYKLSLFNDNVVINESGEKPITFTLNQLIRGWQIGVPLCKAGGSIKLLIPSDLGYSVRTRAAKIPPNSILVFEIDVVQAKSPR